MGALELNDRPFRQWTLKARVLKPDSRFKSVYTEVKFWKNRYDPGMGGLINYAMIIPAGIFLALAFFASLSLAAKGSRAPEFITLTGGVVFLAFFFLPNIPLRLTPISVAERERRTASGLLPLVCQS